MVLTRVFFYLFLTSIPFGTRVLLYQFTPGFNEYSSVFLYASDVFLILFLGFSYSSVLKNTRINFTILKSPLFIFLTLAFLSIFPAVSKGLAVYNFVRLALLVLMALAVAKILRERILKLETIFAVIAGSAVFQSIIGFLQFANQSSLGLKWLGESVLGPDVSGAAKIVVDGAKILRAYGTFPHPNVLAAFLLLGLFSLYYLWMKSDVKNAKLDANDAKCLRKTDWSCEDSKLTFVSVILALAVFVVLTGLILTFSRTAWAIAFILSALLIGYWLVQKQTRRQTFFLLITLLISGCALLAVFLPYILPRAQVSAGEPAVAYRLEYNKVGLNLLRDRPLGVGIGNQVLYSVKNGLYKKMGMNQVWQWQPIHNIYLLVGAEVGILGLLSFLLFIIALITRRVSQNGGLRFALSDLRFATPGMMLMSLLLFGLFDHFLWTIQPGRLMLWLVIGLVTGVNKLLDGQHRSDVL